MERASKNFKLRIRAPRDFWGGIALMALALIAIWASGDLSGMRGFAFGPGTAPRLFAGILFVVGAGVAVTGLLIDGPKIEAYAITAVTAAACSFSRINPLWLFAAAGAVGFSGLL